ncbi:MAG TPA: transposase [Spirochaetota bacterium]|nr:transposase [Spirochaetota bacterium]
MMRKPREIVDGSTYHVSAKINRGEFIFKDRADLKILFFKLVKRTHGKYKFHVQGITVMDNHIHMTIKPSKGEKLGNIMNSILSTFARRYNVIINSHGHVWYDRFKSKVIVTFTQYINTLRYICNNPLRAGMVNDPLSYKFCAVNALYTKEKSELVSIIQSIIDFKNKELLNIYDDYIKEFDVNKAIEKDITIGFYPNNPGRPKKDKK